MTVIHSGLLGALITLAPRPLYATYAGNAAFQEALADQQPAGLIMWMPMGTIYLFAALALLYRGLFRQQGWATPPEAAADEQLNPAGRAGTTSTCHP